MVKDLATRFTEVERRVRAIVEENGRLRSRVRELERELASTRDGAHELERHRVKQTQVRERLERILKTLETIETGGGENPARTSEAHTNDEERHSG